MNSRSARFTLTAAAALAMATTFGCGSLAQVLLSWTVVIGRQLAQVAIMQVINDKIDQWVFNKSAPENQNGDVTPSPTNPLEGNYNGTMRFEVKKDDQGATLVASTEVKNPPMVRAEVGAAWKLKPAFKASIKEFFDEETRRRVPAK